MKIYVRSNSQKITSSIRSNRDDFQPIDISESRMDHIEDLMDKQKDTIITRLEGMLRISGMGLLKGPVEIDRWGLSGSTLFVKVRVNVRADYVLILNSRLYDKDDFSRRLLNFSRDFIISDNIDPDIFIPTIFSNSVRHIDRYSEDDDAKIVEYLYSELGPRYDASGKIDIKFNDKEVVMTLQYSDLRDFYRSKRTWADNMEDLQSEWESGVDSIDEGTSLGSLISDISIEVEDKLGIISEPSVQGGQGKIEFFDASTNDLLAEEDYQVFNDMLIETAIDSTSKSAFKKKLERWYKEMM